ncbi:MAG TPA: hypothetical protein VGM93_14980, partial [Acidimicrobiales bacterium]
MATTSTTRRRSRFVRIAAIATGFVLAAAPVLITSTAGATSAAPVKAATAVKDAHPANRSKPAATAADPAPVGLKASAIKQIAAIRADKKARTPAERKVDSHLLYAENKARTGVAVAGAPNLRADITPAKDGTVLVDVHGTVAAPLLGAIKEAGGTVTSSVPRFGTLQARLPITAVTTLAGRDDVRTITPPVGSQTNNITPPGKVASNGPVTNSVGANSNEADLTQLVQHARNVYGTDGTGVKICVLSDGVDSLAASQANGDLPATVDVLAGQAGTGNEGTAMLEEIHDLAPGADLGFATANPTDAQFAQNILDLQASGCQVIV